MHLRPMKVFVLHMNNSKLALVVTYCLLNFQTFPSSSFFILFNLQGNIKIQNGTSYLTIWRPYLLKECLNCIFQVSRS
jgi:hypothetical protein